MKTIQSFFFVALATILMAADCSNKDSEFYNDVFITAPNLVTVQYDVSVPAVPVLYVNAIFSRYLTVPNHPRPIDLYVSSGGARAFNFSYELEKETAPDVWEVYEVTDSQIISGYGETYTGSFIEANAIYNSNNPSYEYIAGITNLPGGNYRLSFGYNSISTTDVELRSLSSGNNLFVNIKAPYSGLDAGGYYHFTID